MDSYDDDSETEASLLELKSLKDDLQLSMADVQNELNNCLLEVQDISASYKKLLWETENLISVGSTQILQKTPDFIQRREDYLHDLENVETIHDALKETLVFRQSLLSIESIIKPYIESKDYSLASQNTQKGQSKQKKTTIIELDWNLLLQEIIKLRTLSRESIETHKTTIHQHLLDKERKLMIEIENCLVSEWSRCIVTSTKPEDNVIYDISFYKTHEHIGVLLNIYLNARKESIFKLFLKDFYKIIRERVILPFFNNYRQMQLLIEEKPTTTAATTMKISLIKLLDNDDQSNNDQLLPPGSSSSSSGPAAHPLLQLLPMFKVLHQFVWGHELLALPGNKLFTSLISFELLDSLVDDVINLILTPNLPRSRDELANYSTIVQIVNEFCLTMNQLFVMNEKDNDSTTTTSPLRRLGEFVNDVDKLFDERLSELVLSKARELLQKEIFTMKLIEECQCKVFLDNLPVKKSQEDNVANLLEEFTRYMTQTKFHLPSCHVSESFIALCEYLHDVMLMSVKKPSTVENAHSSYLKLVRDVLSLILHVAPSIHEDTLRDIPQAACLFHNNCMYVAHMCFHIHRDFLNELSKQKNHFTNVDRLSNETIIDYIPLLHDLALNIFLTRVTQQQDLIQQYWTDARPFSDLGMRHKQALAQCLHQLKHVHKIWHVLPVHIHIRSLGNLVDGFLNLIMKEILEQSNILEKDANIWIKIIEKLCKELAPFFTEQKENVNNKNDKNQSAMEVTASHYVPSWLRLKELALLLDSNLVQIETRWSSGKGPLAVYWEAFDVRKLIRALFSDSDRRADLLAKIV